MLNNDVLLVAELQVYDVPIKSFYKTKFYAQSVLVINVRQRKNNVGKTLKLPLVFFLTTKIYLEQINK